jgi:hypothetical protein
MTWLATLERSFRAIGAHPRTADRPAPQVARAFPTPVARAADHQASLRAIVARQPRRFGQQPTVRVMLVPEPENLEDPTAVQVCAAPDWQRIGYLTRELAAEIQPRLVGMYARQHAVVVCTARLHPGATLESPIGAGLNLNLELIRSLPA